MSRVGKNPIVLPSGVEVDINCERIEVKGPLGTSSLEINPLIQVIKSENVLTFAPVDETPHAKAMWGTYQALVANMVKGVTKGFERKLLLVGVGFRAQAQGKKLNLSLGFSHPIVHNMPEGVEVATPTPTEIIFKGKCKQAVGQCAADVRMYRPPEPYKGKGLRYADEVVILKEIKKK